MAAASSLYIAILSVISTGLCQIYKINSAGLFRDGFHDKVSFDLIIEGRLVLRLLSVDSKSIFLVTEA